MASYALYLVPSEDTEYPPEIGPALRELQDARKWGGELHMTLCSFARRGKHSCSLRSAAEAAATAGSEEYPGQPFFITKWRGPHRDRSGSLQMFYVDKRSKTLEAVLAALRRAGVYGFRKDVSGLHVSLRSEAAKIAGPMIDFLSQVQWDVCIAKIPERNCENLELRERYQLGC